MGTSTLQMLSLFGPLPLVPCYTKITYTPWNLSQLLKLMPPYPMHDYHVLISYIYLHISEGLFFQTVILDKVMTNGEK